MDEPKNDSDAQADEQTPEAVVPTPHDSVDVPTDAAVTPEPTPAVESVWQPQVQEPVTSAPLEAPQPVAPVVSSDESVSSKKFLPAYVASIFSAFALLASGSWLGYVLLDQWLSPKTTNSPLFYLDLAPLYVSLMSSMVIFGLLYFVTSQHVTRCVKRDAVDSSDWRLHNIVYAWFSGILLVVGASVLASFLYIPIAQLTLADEFKAYEVGVQLLGGVHVLLWIGLLLWSERLIKQGKHALQAMGAVLALIAVIVILTAIFPIGSKTDERYDAKVSADLSTIEMAVSSYEAEHTGQLPSSLSDLTFDQETGVKNRLSNYTYTKQQSSTANSYDSQVLGVQGEVGSSRDYMYPTPSGASYQLCATFRTDTSKSDSSSPIPAFSGLSTSSSSVSFTKHKTGKVCFDRN